MKQSRSGLLSLLLFCFFLFSACDSDTPEKAAEPEESNFNYVSEIVPSVDGGAYAISGEVIWYLKGSEAIKVRKVEKFSTQPAISLNTNREKFFWTLWRSEIAKCKRLLEPPEEFDLDGYDPY
jgi:hypothetical protein